MKYLGVDFGVKKIGLASGDDETNLAFPIGNIDGGMLAVPHVIDAAKKEGADAIVVGLPIPNINCSLEQLERTKDFVRMVQSETLLPVFVVDEQFSSAEARRIQREHSSGVSEDALAATVILQAFLDGDRGLTLETAHPQELE